MFMRVAVFEIKLLLYRTFQLSPDVDLLGVLLGLEVVEM
jgi:hypothetical protein